MSTTLTCGTRWPHTNSAPDGDQSIRLSARRRTHTSTPTWALHAAADHLRQVAEQSDGYADPAASWRARHLAAAATQLTAGRDLLHSHLATGLNGVTRGRSEWALVVTSLPVTRALASEIARWSGQLAPFTAWLAGSAMTHSPPLMPGQTRHHRR